MTFIKSPADIIATISRLKNSEVLWIDTEIADFNSKKPKLSLIQVSEDPDDMSGEHIYVLDVLENGDTIDIFIEEIMLNTQIEKVFHNASYDLKFLGGKKAQNTTCTLEMAKKIPYYYLPVPNYKLQTLARELCNYQNIDKSQQISDWGCRPLTAEQIDYAYLDCIYLAQIHQRLLVLSNELNPNPEEDDLASLTARYEEIYEQHKLLDSEFKHLEERIKKAMQAQSIQEVDKFKLTTYERTSSQLKLHDLIKIVREEGLELDFPITITQKIKANLGDWIDKMPIQTETKNIAVLNKKKTIED